GKRLLRHLHCADILVLPATIHLLLDLQPERPSKLVLADGCCPFLQTLLSCLFPNQFRYCFWSCYPSFFRCKVSVQTGMAESLGQWRSFTNLPLSSLRFCR